MQPETDHYVPVWQTWNLIRSCAKTNVAPNATDTSSNTAVAPSRDLRERVQIARIQKRLTVHELAERVRCDVETFASFERGEGVVSNEVQQRLISELGI